MISPAAPAASNRPYAWWFAGLVAGITALRLWLAAHVPMTGDEAYYWQWSRHLAAGYHDHPPMVAWLVAFSEWALGHSVFATRLPSVILGVGTAVLMYLLGLAVCRSHRFAFWTGLLFLATPVFNAASVAVFPDTPLMFFSALFLYVAYRAVFGGGWGWWLLAGAAAGGALLSKLMGGFAPLSLFVYLVCSKERRRWLLRWEPYAAIVLMGLVITPFVLWNAHHGWETVMHQVNFRASRMEGPSLIAHLPEYLAFQLAIVSPIIIGLMVAAFTGVFKKAFGDRSESAAFLALQFGVIHGFFLMVGVFTRPALHWAVPGYLAAYPLVMLWWECREIAAGVAFRTRVLRAAVAVGLVLTGVVYGIVAFPGAVLQALAGHVVAVGDVNKGESLKSAEIAEMFGYGELGREVNSVANEMTVGGTPPPFVLTESYALSSAIAFYSGRPTALMMGTAMGREYFRWVNFYGLMGRNAVYVDVEPWGQRKDIYKTMNEAFTSVQPDPPFVMVKDGIQVRTFYLMRCYGFRAAAGSDFR